MMKKLMAKMTNTANPEGSCAYLRADSRCVLICSGLGGYNRIRTYYYDQTDGSLCFTRDATSCGC